MQQLARVLLLLSLLITMISCGNSDQSIKETTLTKSLQGRAHTVDQILSHLQYVKVRDTAPRLCAIISERPGEEISFSSLDCSQVQPMEFHFGPADVTNVHFFRNTKMSPPSCFMQFTVHGRTGLVSVACSPYVQSLLAR